MKFVSPRVGVASRTHFKEKVAEYPLRKSARSAGNPPRESAGKNLPFVKFPPFLILYRELVSSAKSGFASLAERG